MSFPIAIMMSGTNTHDVKLLGETLDNIVMRRPQKSRRIYALMPDTLDTEKKL